MGEPAAWAYVDARRAHRIDARVRRGARTEFVVTERATDAPDESDALVRRHVLVEAWEARVHQHELEQRLALLGDYLRTAGGPWTPVRASASLITLDLEPLDLRAEGETVHFHHFVDADKHAVTLVGLRQDLARGERWLLARLDYLYPNVEDGNLQLVHAHLPAFLYRSALAEQHLELRALGFRKEQRERAASDVRSWQALGAVLRAVLARLLEGRLGSPRADGNVAREDALAAIEAVAAARRAREAGQGRRVFETEFEMAPPPPPVEGKAPEMLMEELSDDVVRALEDPRLRRLHRRFFTREEEADLMDAGELAVHRALVKVHSTTDPRERHLVSLLEASILVRRALLKRTRVDRAMIDRVLHAPVVLGL